MSGGSHWTMARRNLTRNRRRNLATGFAIALGFAALLALGGYIHRTQNYLRVYTIYANRVGHITVYKKDGLERFSTRPKQYSLNAADQAAVAAAVQAEPNVEMHGPQLTGAGLIGNGCRTLPFLATGLDPALDRRLREHPEMRFWLPTIGDYVKGRGLWEYPADVGAIGVSTGLARLLHKTRVYDELPKDQKVTVVVDCLAPGAKDQIAADTNVQLLAGSWSGMMAAQDGEVVANFNTGVTETNNAAVLTSLTYLQRLYDTPNVAFWSVWLKDPGDLDETLASLRAKLAAAGLAVDVYPWTDEAVSPFYTGTMQFLFTMVGFVTVVLATVIIFSVFNAATMTVIERAQEIGMMRSLGYTRGEIRRLFVMEMLLLAGLSVAAGGAVGAAGIAAVNAAAVQLNPPGVAGGMLLRLMPNAPIVVGAAALIFGLAVLTTLVAVRSVANRNIASLLMGTQR